MTLKAVAITGGGGGGGISGSGTAGYVAKFTSSTAVGNSLVRDDGSQVSIDVTPSPGYKLTVNGDTTIAGRIDALTGSINTVTSRASNDLVFQRDTVEAARIIAGGKVGFGNTDPATLIETYGTTGIRASSDTIANIGVFQYSSDTSPATLTLRKARGTRAAQTTVATGDAMGSVNFTAYGGASGSVLSSISGNVVTYTSNANITSNLTFGTSAAGAATPTTRLTIDEAGVSTFTGPVRATGTSAGAPAFTGSDTDTGMYFPANNQVRFSTNGSVAMAIDASQRVGVNQATPISPLHVLGTSITAASTTTASAGTLRVEGSATNALFCGSFSDSPFGMCLQTNSASYPLVLQPAGGSVGIKVTSPATNTLDVSTATWGVKLATTPGNGDANTLDCYVEANWTPTDASGAGMTLTQTGGVTARYTQIGRQVVCFCDITYPATILGGASAAAISLPVSAGSAQGGHFIGGGSTALWGIVSGANLLLYNFNTLTATTNTTIGASRRLIFTLTYFVS